MKIKLNVRVNLTSSGQLFTIWPKSHNYLPGIEFYTGQGASTTEAVENLLCALPNEFVIDDEIAVQTTSLEFHLHRPFEIVCSDNVRIFSLA